MEDINIAAEQLAQQTQRFAAFTGTTNPNPEDRFVLVMGMAGSGKSTLIARCTGQDIPINNSLYSRT
jgi:ABC-type lipoprotein export system ATPase subunit